MGPDRLPAALPDGAISAPGSLPDKDLDTQFPFGGDTLHGSGAFEFGLLPRNFGEVKQHHKWNEWESGTPKRSTSRAALKKGSKKARLPCRTDVFDLPPMSDTILRWRAPTSSIAPRLVPVEAGIGTNFPTIGREGVGILHHNPRPTDLGHQQYRYDSLRLLYHASSQRGREHSERNSLI